MTNAEKGSALAELRARTALRSAGLDPSVPLERASSVTNEVWLTPDHVVRVNRDRNDRLAREAVIAAILPPAVGYPRVVAQGHRQGEDWLVAERAPGVPLAHRWPHLSTDERHRAVTQLAQRLMALHATPAPLGLPPIEGAPQLLEIGTDDPTAPVVAALRDAAQLEHVDRLMIHEAIEMVGRLTPVLLPYEATTLVHGDVTFENVLWDDGQVTALLDVEWARAGPADLDLDIVLRCCAYPKLHVAEAFEADTRAADYVEVPAWLAEAYPRLFSYPHERDRLRVFAIAYEVRELLAFPPMVSVEDLSPRHAHQRLARIVNRSSYLD